jgi:syntaxin-binding protein 1
VELGRVLQNLQSGTSSTSGKVGGFMNMFRGKAAPAHKPTAEGEYADTRHLCRIRVLLDQLIANELPVDQFASIGPSGSSGGAGESKTAKSARKFGTNSRWGRKDQTMFSGGRYVVFIAGGVAYSELRAAYDVMTQNTKEIIIGGSHIVNPTDYIADVAAMHPQSLAAMGSL